MKDTLILIQGDTEEKANTKSNGKEKAQNI